MVQRDKSHAVIGLTFVLVSIFIAFAIYYALKAQRATSFAPSANGLSAVNASAAVAENRSPQLLNAAPTNADGTGNHAAVTDPESVAGNWAEQVDDKGNCAGEGWILTYDGALYHRMENGVALQGHWKIKGNMIALRDQLIRDEDGSVVARFPNENLPFAVLDDRLILGGKSFYTCLNADQL